MNYPQVDQFFARKDHDTDAHSANSGGNYSAYSEGDL